MEVMNMAVPRGSGHGGKDRQNLNQASLFRAPARDEPISDSSDDEYEGESTAQGDGSFVAIREHDFVGMISADQRLIDPGDLKDENYVPPPSSSTKKQPKPNLPTKKQITVAFGTELSASAPSHLDPSHPPSKSNQPSHGSISPAPHSEWEGPIPNKGDPRYMEYLEFKVAQGERKGSDRPPSQGKPAATKVVDAVLEPNASNVPSDVYKVLLEEYTKKAVEVAELKTEMKASNSRRSFNMSAVRGVNKSLSLLNTFRSKQVPAWSSKPKALGGGGEAIPSNPLLQNMPLKEQADEAFPAASLASRVLKEHAAPPMATSPKSKPLAAVAETNKNSNADKIVAMPQTSHMYNDAKWTQGLLSKAQNGTTFANLTDEEKWQCGRLIRVVLEQIENHPQKGASEKGMLKSLLQCESNLFQDGQVKLSHLRDEMNKIRQVVKQVENVSLADRWQNAMILRVVLETLPHIPAVHAERNRELIQQMMGYFAALFLGTKADQQYLVSKPATLSELLQKADLVIQIVSSFTGVATSSKTISAERLEALSQPRQARAASRSGTGEVAESSVLATTAEKGDQKGAGKPSAGDSSSGTKADERKKKRESEQQFEKQLQETTTSQRSFANKPPAKVVPAKNEDLKQSKKTESDDNPFDVNVATAGAEESAPPVEAAPPKKKKIAKPKPDADVSVAKILEQKNKLRERQKELNELTRQKIEQKKKEEEQKAKVKPPPPIKAKPLNPKVYSKEKKEAWVFPKSAQEKIEMNKQLKEAKRKEAEELHKKKKFEIGDRMDFSQKNHKVMKEMKVKEIEATVQKEVESTKVGRAKKTVQILKHLKQKKKEEKVNPEAAAKSVAEKLKMMAKGPSSASAPNSNSNSNGTIDIYSVQKSKAGGGEESAPPSAAEPSTKPPAPAPSNKSPLKETGVQTSVVPPRKTFTRILAKYKKDVGYVDKKQELKANATAKANNSMTPPKSQKKAIAKSAKASAATPPKTDDDAGNGAETNPASALAVDDPESLLQHGEKKKDGEETKDAKPDGSDHEGGDEGDDGDNEEGATTVEGEGDGGNAGGDESVSGGEADLIDGVEDTLDETLEDVHAEESADKGEEEEKVDSPAPASDATASDTDSEKQQKGDEKYDENKEPTVEEVSDEEGTVPSDIEEGVEDDDEVIASHSGSFPQRKSTVHTTSERVLSDTDSEEEEAERSRVEEDDELLSSHEQQQEASTVASPNDKRRSPSPPTKRPVSGTKLRGDELDGDSDSDDSGLVEHMSDGMSDESM